MRSFLLDATYGDVTMCDQVVRLYCDAQMCGRPARDPNPHNVGPSKVVNGDVAEIEAWPWMVSMTVCVTFYNIILHYTSQPVLNRCSCKAPCKKNVHMSVETFTFS